MNGRALLIGSGGSGREELTGVPADLAAMEATLDGFGFAVETCTGMDATREGILSAYRRLIEAVGPEDAAVVYYTGHGGWVPAPPPDSRFEQMDLQFIAPYDFHDSTHEDFRGIASVELSVLLSELTDKTANATVVLDCCYAGMMSRDIELRVKSLRDPTPYEQVVNHLNRLVEAGQLDIGRFRSGGSQTAVRLVACQRYQSAHAGQDGTVSLFTGALTTALAALGTQRVSWESLMVMVRRTVLGMTQTQRPDVEGPARRLIFSVEEDDLLTALPVADIGGGRLRLDCAPLLGVQADDEFMIMPAGSVAADAGTKVGDLKVDAVAPTTVSGPLTLATGWSEVPPGARAFRTVVTAPPVPVSVPDDGPGAADLTKAINAAPLLRPAQPGEPAIAEVKIGADGDLTLHDRIGPLHRPRRGDTTGVTQVVRDLRVIAQAATLRSLSSSPEWALKADVSIEWGRVVDGAPVPLPPHGATVRVGDRIYVTVRNNGRAGVFVSLIDIGVSGKIQVVTSFARGGYFLDAGQEWTLGLEELPGKLTGVPLSWPQGLDPSAARPETLLVLLTSAAQDVTPLEHGGIGRGDAPSGSPLEQIFLQLADGRARGTRIDGSPVRFDTYTIDFELGPIPDEGGFLIDERPDPAALHVIPRGIARGAAPATVAVRVEELIIHENHAWFGADIRVDALVVTGRHAHTEPVYLARTERFPNIRDEQALPLDRMLVYHGPAVDYLDLAIWVSRDSKDSLALGNLLSTDLNGDEVQRALAALGGTVVAAPHAAAAAALIGAGAIIINVAYRALRRITGDSIGLYRGSRLAAEQFGVGRHPRTGARRAQGFSIAYSIEDVS